MRQTFNRTAVNGLYWSQIFRFFPVKSGPVSGLFPVFQLDFQALVRHDVRPCILRLLCRRHDFSLRHVFRARGWRRGWGWTIRKEVNYFRCPGVVGSASRFYKKFATSLKKINKFELTVEQWMS